MVFNGSKEFVVNGSVDRGVALKEMVGVFDMS